MRRLGGTLFTAITLTACSAAPSPAPPAVVDVALAPSPVNTRFRGHMTIDFAPLGGREIDTAGEAVASTARGRMPAMLACMRSMPPAPTDVWLVGRVGDDGALGSIVAAKDLPPDVAACAVKALEGIRIPSGDPLAISVVLRGEPAPANCSGEACVELPVPSGLVEDDGPVGAAPELPVNMIGDAGEDVSLFGGLSAGGEGIGLGTFGTFGHGTGAGSGGRLGGARRKLQPQVRIGALTVNGRLPADVIRRIVRQNVGRIRLCYDNGRKTNASLTGVVTVDFTIAADGSVSEHSSAKSDLPDSKVVGCIENTFASLSFPAPEAGIVKVSSPIALLPPEEPEALRVGGVGFPGLDADRVAAKLGEKGWRTMAVPGATRDAPFAVFAVKVGASTDPIERPQGFVTSVRREADEGYEPISSRTSEGLRLVAEGDAPGALLDDLIDPPAPEKAP